MRRRVLERALRRLPDHGARSTRPRRRWPSSAPPPARPVTPRPARDWHSTHEETVMKGLAGKVAVVTGGSSGIGQAIAIRLGEEGVDVAINYVGRPDGAEETKDAIEHGVDICMKQMADAAAPSRSSSRRTSPRRTQVAAMFAEVLERVRPASTYLINNAGIQIAEDTEKLVGRRLRQGPRRQPARLVPVRPAGDPALPRLRPRRLDRQRLERAPGHPEAALPRLLGVQGRHAEPDPHARAGVRRARASGSTASARAPP